MAKRRAPKNEPRKDESDPLSALPRAIDQALATLDPNQQKILAALALAGNRPLDPHEWQAEYRRHAGSNTVAQFKATVDQLLAAKLIDQLPSSGYFVAPCVVLQLFCLLHADGRLAPLVAKQPPPRHMASLLMTKLRVALVTANAHTIADVTTEIYARTSAPDVGALLLAALDLAPPPAVLARLPETLLQPYVHEVVTRCTHELLPLPANLSQLVQTLDDKPLRLAFGRIAILRGEDVQACLPGKLPRFGHEGLTLLAAFFRGDYGQAAQLGDEALAAMKSRKHKVLPGLEGICHVVARLACAGDDPQALLALTPTIEAGAGRREGWGLTNHMILESLHRALLGDRSELPAMLSHPHLRMNWLELWLAALHDIWLGIEAAKDDDDERRVGAAARLFRDLQMMSERRFNERARAQLQTLAHAAQIRGYPPLARELSAVNAVLQGPKRPKSADVDGPSLARAFRAASPWETALTGLDAVIAGAHQLAGGETQRERSLVWEIDVNRFGCSVHARLRESARARKGKSIGVKRLLSGELDDVLGDEDRRVLAAVDVDEHWHTDTVSLGSRAVVALIGHPRVVAKDGTPLSVVRVSPSIHTKRNKHAVRVDFPHPALLDEAVVRRVGDRIEVIERTDALTRVAEIIGDGLEIPIAGAERLLRTLGRLTAAAGLEIVGDLQPESETVAADPRPLLQIDWDGERLTVDARVAPLGVAGPHLRPGVGVIKVADERSQDGALQLLSCERDLDDERRRLAAVADRCPTLSSYPDGPQRWLVPVLADALEIMLEIAALGDEVALAWPAKRPLQVPLRRELNDLDLTVTSGKNWLSVEASLPVEEGVVLGFRQLIEGRAGGRFVALGEGRFLALSEQLRRRLDALEGLGEVHGASLRANPVMLPLLDELAGDLDEPQFDARARAQLERLRTLATTAPRRPRRFAAELRDYQKDGYAWMWRLAQAGFGACLADDMGLGKTVQTLALLSQRANEGPALVVCPTSVVINWIAETERFAPTLRPRLLADAGDRAAVLQQLGRRDLLVCSYGVLASEAEALATVSFATAVFDEAHALKNDRTKRARAARGIQADFRLALTGTPVENRVDELWSLFRVIVPGLLGSKAQFEDRFAKPIAQGDRERAGQLRALLRHFILRRTKAQVLDELPARTEITLRITPSADERAYYEALRRQAVDIVESDPRKKRFRILAEITKLRQAAVDPRLLDPDAAPGGSKIAALLEQLQALRDEGHRALVFTQFLGSMALVRQALTAAGIEYLDLDGSTPAAERARRVDAFQGGEADVFLLSLRAGGVGMNLTGADYVLHLDPWWNPAVEDQATDRAHRIGQTRPVTVYRLISAGTIEEKILDLHGRKRELADDILEGLGGGETLDLEELIGLLGD